MDDSKLEIELADRSPKRFKKGGNNEGEEAYDKKEVIAQSRWEDLPVNCLVEVLGRLSLDDLTLGVPFVCKSWYEALQDPACWKTLDFSATGSQFSEKFKCSYRVEKFTLRGFLKVIISRSHKVSNKAYNPGKPLSAKGFGLCMQRMPIVKYLHYVGWRARFGNSNSWFDSKNE